MTSAWADFRLETFGDPYLVWHDGADYGALLRRWRDQPSPILAMLRLGLAESDPVAAGSIEYLAGHGADVGDLDGLLREVLPGAEGRFRVRVATALLQLTGDQHREGHAPVEPDPGGRPADLVRSEHRAGPALGSASVARPATTEAARLSAGKGQAGRCRMVVDSCYDIRDA